jgi:hypothetical protein
MDGVNVESVDRMHQGEPWVQKLLCGTALPSLEAHGATKLREWFSAHDARAYVGITLAVEKAPNDLRQLNERFVPSGRSH